MGESRKGVSERMQGLGQWSQVAWVDSCLAT